MSPGATLWRVPPGGDDFVDPAAVSVDVSAGHLTNSHLSTRAPAHVPAALRALSAPVGLMPPLFPASSYMQSLAELGLSHGALLYWTPAAANTTTTNATATAAATEASSLGTGETDVFAGLPLALHAHTFPLRPLPGFAPPLSVHSSAQSPQSNTNTATVASHALSGSSAAITSVTVQLQHLPAGVFTTESSGLALWQPARAGAHWLLCALAPLISSNTTFNNDSSVPRSPLPLNGPLLRRRGLRCVELGAGAGLLSAAVAELLTASATTDSADANASVSVTNPRHVLAVTDKNAQALALAARNAAVLQQRILSANANAKRGTNVSIDYFAFPLTWTTPASRSDPEPGYLGGNTLISPAALTQCRCNRTDADDCADNGICESSTDHRGVRQLQHRLASGATAVGSAPISVNGTASAGAILTRFSRPDLVVASDVVYDAAAVGSLFATVSALFTLPHNNQAARAEELRVYSDDSDDSEAQRWDVFVLTHPPRSATVETLIAECARKEGFVATKHVLPEWVLASAGVVAPLTKAAATASASVVGGEGLILQQVFVRPATANCTLGHSNVI